MSKLRMAGVLVGFIGAGLVVSGLKETQDAAAPILLGFLLIGVGFLSYKSR